MKRNTRLRREYLFKKSLEGKNELEAGKKQKLERALESNSKIPDALVGESAKLRASMAWDDGETKQLKTHVDDEYAKTSMEPRICVTTSRDPSSKLKEFSKELKMLFPESRRVNRGQTTLAELVQSCTKAEFTDIVLCTEHRGDPDGLIICHLPFGPTMRVSITDCVTRHDIDCQEPASEAFPHLLFHDMESALGNRVKSILTHLFPVPKLDSKRVVTFYNKDDVISFRHSLVKKIAGGDKGKPTLVEVGPRFEMRPYEIRLGTMDQKSSEVEWVLRSYINSAKKKRLFSGEGKDDE
ncbi:hypothetical protein BASA82_000181 [Batrachochytrium salamandrivorans]|nr:hypothetical protein BASA81_001501 [Batrachochytrium salamandrivorans]KAH9262795.1 hypothetical protein BASA82_000181 [Batrachochytrium salamandrivorans]